MMGSLICLRRYPGTGARVDINQTLLSCKIAASALISDECAVKSKCCSDALAAAAPVDLSAHPRILPSRRTAPGLTRDKR